MRGHEPGTSLVVRFNGGPQAGHNVVTPDGRHHCFAQLGAGGFVPGTRTFLSRFMLVEPLSLEREEHVLRRGQGVQGTLERLTIDRRAVVVTPFHKHLNRLKEVARGAARHGSCGRGIGQAWLDAETGAMPVLRAGDLADRPQAHKRLKLLRLVKIDQAEQVLDAHLGAPFEAELRHGLAEMRSPGLVEDLLDRYGAFASQRGISFAGPDGLSAALAVAPHAVFEGAQGALLDPEWGFWPHCTPTRTGFENALELLAKAAPDRSVTRIGMLRVFSTRHGAGPFPAEDASLAARFRDPFNPPNAWQGPLRVGWFDELAAHYALSAVGGVDELALTHLDRLAGLDRVGMVRAYDVAGTRWDRLPAPGDREAQGALTEDLANARPVLRWEPGWTEPRGPEAARFAATLAARLGATLGPVSYGPRAPDKAR